jgi:hypothetical protein
MEPKKKAVLSTHQHSRTETIGFETLFKKEEPPPEGWLSLRQIADKANMSVSAVDNRLRRARVPRVKYRGLWYYRP